MFPLGKLVVYLIMQTKGKSLTAILKLTSLKMTDKIDNFNDIAPNIFKILIDDFGYSLKEITTHYINNEKWSTHHIYVNNSLNLKIVVKQEPYYTDYGFSFFIYQIKTEQYDILYNVPHEKQDKEDKFLLKVYENMFSNKEILDIINGKKWKGQKDPFPAKN
ncbi:Hypothetical protein KQS_04875 [Flavobacterium indicum GPTSA100-9 = DSM 17447]|uniref:Uncharacterized protein n=2 Tax=Flavobacterium TaxID=237 RepID=H8XUF8_FLAIG|nr:Hypothetical protein KQS_04875 [Flavobacterium indicum GPTSA100-9 = DSM 17447]